MVETQPILDQTSADSRLLCFEFSKRTLRYSPHGVVLSIPAFEVNWTIEIEDGDQAFDLTDAIAVLDQVGFVLPLFLAGALPLRSHVHLIFANI